MRYFFAFLLIASHALAAIHYVDSGATGANDGSSWANAWTSLPSGSVGAGDTVYISGGATGSTKTYTTSLYWVPPSGSAGNRITYQIGQDSAHNGTAIFNQTNSSYSSFITGMAYTNIVGDAGDGACHFKLTGHYYAVADNTNNTRIAYIDATTLPILSYFGIFTGTGMEIDHNLVKITDMTADYAISLGMSGSGFDENLIHHNVIQNPVLSSGLNGSGGNGPDYIQGGGSVSIYNNTFQGYAASPTAGQHQDGWQIQGGNQYIKFYNNKLIDVSNYGFYGEALHGGFNHLWVYNNLMVITISSLNSAGGVIIGVNAYDGTLPVPFNDVIVANNLIVNYQTGNGNTSGVSCNNNTGFSATFTGCYIVNNCFVDGATSVDTSGNTGSTYANNVAVSTANGAANFTSYTRFSGLSNDYTLKTGSALIGVGTSMASFFTTDIAGATRTTWDVGPYYYSSGGGGGSAPTIQTQPSSQTVTVGANVTFTLASSNATSYQWQKGGSNIGGATSTTYTITGVITGDAGNYTCIATNANGSTTSSTAVLTVNTVSNPSFHAGRKRSITGPY